MPLVPRLAVLGAACLVSSCASVFSDDYTVVAIRTRPEGMTVRTDSLSVHASPTRVVVPRSDRPIVITATNDSIVRTVTVEPFIGTKFWVGNLVSGFPVSYMLDLGSVRKFDFDQVIFIDAADSSRTYPNWRHGMFEPGDLRIGGALSAMTMTYLAYFALDTGGSIWRTGGVFLNGGASIDLFDGRDRFFRVDARALTTAGGECFEGCPPSLVQFSGAALRGHLARLGGIQLELGYGLRYSSHVLIYHPDSFPEIPDRWINTVGATISGGVRIGQHVTLIADYSPAVPVAGGRFSYDLTLRLQFSTARTEPGGWSD